MLQLNICPYMATLPLSKHAFVQAVGAVVAVDT